ncbi:enoyl-CoA hydratase/isomerase family protein [Mycobacterium xenopi]|nr:enoyl-CoA hydratase/isomerase family protein [Mycobacterium xenopi]MDA3656515.1 enoyl-CoA hydratase/isomerase family protein [Mycobacterium xenopi]MDA3662906.1 enoyl-CoA hydratase/isomerase family protein [Mycobacterium xenopi]
MAQGGSTMNVEALDGVTIARLDHPQVNALDLALLDAVVATMRGIEGPVVLTGAGKCFSAGVDLRAILGGGREYTDDFITALSAAFLAVFDHPAPVIAAVNGHAIAGGCVFAMAADTRVMSTGTIGLTELAVGVPFPVTALEICRYAMGASITRATLQAKTLGVHEASAQGWIDEVVEQDELIPRAVAIARELGEHSPTAYAATKDQLHRPVHAAIKAGADMDAQARADWLTDETRSRITAFVDALARNRR